MPKPEEYSPINWTEDMDPETGKPITPTSAQNFDHMDSMIDDHNSFLRESTNEPSPDTLALRDSNGRLKAENPSHGKDTANKEYVDNEIDNEIDNHRNETDAHSATNEPTANRIALRDGSGRTRVENPVHDKDVANKGYLENADPIRVSFSGVIPENPKGEYDITEENSLCVGIFFAPPMVVKIKRVSLWFTTEQATGPYWEIEGPDASWNTSQYDYPRRLQDMDLDEEIFTGSTHLVHPSIRVNVLGLDDSNEVVRGGFWIEMEFIPV